MPLLHTQKDEHAHLTAKHQSSCTYQWQARVHFGKRTCSTMCPGKLYLHLYATVSGHLTPSVTQISTLLQK
uniref:Uncharacterized protein n=1 Tax=Arundo donax TaxID=35708 RepID=A0A0A9DV64_ARUDO